MAQARVTADPSYYPKAEGVLQQSLAIDGSENYQAMVGMGALALARHDFTGALQWGEKAKAIDPYNVAVYGVIGDALNELGRYRAAFRTFEEMENLKPGVAAYSRTSYARELQGSPAGAIRAMQAARDASSTQNDTAWADYTIRLKNVIMGHNLDDTCEVARFANQDGMEIFFQPIEQNYNTPEDSKWFEHSDNWPRDTEKAIGVVRQLIAYKKQGWHIANSYEQLETMIPYFRNPDSMRVSVQSHSAHERRALCSALTTLDFRANGDVVACFGQAPIGNIKKTPIREIWENRPHWWDSECCLDRRCSVAEKEQLSLVSIA